MFRLDALFRHQGVDAARTTVERGEGAAAEINKGLYVAARKCTLFQRLSCGAERCSLRTASRTVSSAGRACSQYAGRRRDGS